MVKDVGFILISIFAILGLRYMEKDKIKMFAAFFTPLFVLTLVLFFLSYTRNPLQALSGLRWIMPLFIALFLICKIDDKFMTQIAGVVSFIFLLSVVLQILELAVTKPLWSLGFDRMAGCNVLGLPRLWGMFSMPTTCGFFSLLAMFFAYFYVKKSALRGLTLLFAPISILLCGSATALLVYIIAGYIILKRKFSTKFLSYILPLIILVILIFLPSVTGREKIYHSVTNRMRIFHSLLTDSEIISTRFGAGTNTMIQIAKHMKEDRAFESMDSTLSALLVNTGMIGSFVFLAGYILWVVYILRLGRLDGVIFTIVYTLFSFTISLTEAFPMNLLFAVGIGYFLCCRPPRPAFPSL
ncbi:MAG: hypothetical protein ABID09_02160 [Candidatus Omnitrophota bacterium]